MPILSVAFKGLRLLTDIFYINYSTRTIDQELPKLLSITTANSKLKHHILIQSTKPGTRSLGYTGYQTCTGQSYKCQGLEGGVVVVMSQNDQSAFQLTKLSETAGAQYNLVALADSGMLVDMKVRDYLVTSTTIAQVVDDTLINLGVETWLSL